MIRFKHVYAVVFYVFGEKIDIYPVNADNYYDAIEMGHRKLGVSGPYVEFRGAYLAY